jgi:hypothetical protein
MQVCGSYLRKPWKTQPKLLMKFDTQIHAVIRAKKEGTGVSRREKHKHYNIPFFIILSTFTIIIII